MNKINASIIGLIAIISLSSGAMAAYTGPVVQNKVSVTQLKNLADDSLVTLQGNLTKHLGGEYYLFRDESGEIEVEVDNKVWRGITVGPEDLLNIRGEVDKSWNRPTKIDVGFIEKISDGGAQPQAQGGFITQ